MELVAKRNPGTKSRYSISRFIDARKDGICLINDIKRLKPNIQFIMISQVLSKDMIGKAYECGAEYYINKPINALEIDNVLKKVIEKIKMERAIEQIQKLVKIEDIYPKIIMII